MLYGRRLRVWDSSAYLQYLNASLSFVNLLVCVYFFTYYQNLSLDVLNTMDVEDESETPSSRGNQDEEHEERVKELDEFDEDVDEFIFPEGDKFDIRLKGRVRK
nr:hypothetical protein [Tanacetum cinerariifolium]